MKSMIANLIEEEIFNTHYLAESETEFIQRICDHIFSEVSYLKKYAPTEYHHEIVGEIEDQVIEVFKIKTYGFSSLQQYRKIHRAKPRRIG